MLHFVKFPIVCGNWGLRTPVLPGNKGHANGVMATIYRRTADSTRWVLQPQ